eukprot:1182343-Prorocentrum_minimum.AAC.1
MGDTEACQGTLTSGRLGSPAVRLTGVRTGPDVMDVDGNAVVVGVVGGVAAAHARQLGHRRLRRPRVADADGTGRGGRPRPSSPCCPRTPCRGGGGKAARRPSRRRNASWRLPPASAWGDWGIREHSEGLSEKYSAKDSADRGSGRSSPARRSDRVFSSRRFGHFWTSRA